MSRAGPCPTCPSPYVRSGSPPSLTIRTSRRHREPPARQTDRSEDAWVGQRQEHEQSDDDEHEDHAADGQSDRPDHVTAAVADVLAIVDRIKRRSAGATPRTCSVGSGPPLRVTLAAGDGLPDPAVVGPVAPPPQAEERGRGGCGQECADRPAIDTHGGEPRAWAESPYPPIGGLAGRTTPGCYRGQVTFRGVRQIWDATSPPRQDSRARDQCVGRPSGTLWSWPPPRALPACRRRPGRGVRRGRAG